MRRQADLSDEPAIHRQTDSIADGSEIKKCV
jgi:hypothetical protein